VCWLCIGSGCDAAGLRGEGEGAAARLPQGLTDGEQDTQEDEPQLLPHGELMNPLLVIREFGRNQVQSQ